MNAAGLLVAALVFMPGADPPRPMPGPTVSPNFNGIFDTTVATGGYPGAVVPVAAPRAEPTTGVTCSFTASPAATSALGSSVFGSPQNVPVPVDPTVVHQQLRGQMYLRACSDGTSSTVWVPDVVGGAAPAGAVPVVTPAMLAAEARNRLALPEPTFSYNPNPQVSKVSPLVNFPTWWWITNSPGTMTQRTAVGPVWAEVTARPVGTTWTPSTGEARVCAGLGVAWEPGLETGAVGACTFTYRHSHTSEKATISVDWEVSWTGSGGAGGTFPATTMTTTLTTPVYERQAIITNPASPGSRS